MFYCKCQMSSRKKNQQKKKKKKKKKNLTLEMPRKPASENVVCLTSAEYSCKLFKPIFAYRQTVWTLIRLLLEEQSDLGPHCLQKWLLKSQAGDKADNYNVLLWLVV